MRNETLPVLAIVAIATLPLRCASAQLAPDAYLDLPISQSVNRNGTIRYAIWVKVGERSVQALLDTGSTGLRVLPSVLPSEPTPFITDITFGAGLHMQGYVVRAPVEIGSRSGMALVEVVQSIACVKDKPDCGVEPSAGESYLIGGDGFPSEGYSAIVGIGFPFRGTDLGNPLSALGIKRWIVNLPRPDAIPEGHLILDPDEHQRDGFAMLDRNGIADADGCIQGKPLPEEKCGTVLFDTGAPAISVSFAGVKTTTAWDQGETGVFKFMSKEKMLGLDFRAGSSGGLIKVLESPPNPHDPPKPFILAGIEPFYSYDILYDGEAKLVGLRKRISRALPNESGAGTNASHVEKAQARHLRTAAIRPPAFAAADRGIEGLSSRP